MYNPIAAFSPRPTTITINIITTIITITIITIITTTTTTTITTTIITTTTHDKISKVSIQAGKLRKNGQIVDS